MMSPQTTARKASVRRFKVGMTVSLTPYDDIDMTGNGETTLGDRRFYTVAKRDGKWLTLEPVDERHKPITTRISFVTIPPCEVINPQGFCPVFANDPVQKIAL